MGTSLGFPFTQSHIESFSPLGAKLFLLSAGRSLSLWGSSFFLQMPLWFRSQGVSSCSQCSSSFVCLFLFFIPKDVTGMFLWTDDNLRLEVHAPSHVVFEFSAGLRGWWDHCGVVGYLLIWRAQGETTETPGVFVCWEPAPLPLSAPSGASTYALWVGGVTWRIVVGFWYS